MKSKECFTANYKMNEDSAPAEKPSLVKQDHSLTIETHMYKICLPAHNF